MKKGLAQKLITALNHQSDKINAAAMGAYMKDNFEFFGVKSQTRSQCMREVLKENKLPEVEILRAEIKELWLCPKREAQYLALEIYRKEIKNENEDAIEFLQWMITTGSWWDTVDSIASNLVGPLVSKFPSIKNTHLNFWINDKNLWLRRTSLIFQLKYKDQVDEDFLTRAIEANIHDKDFFMRKAIGWSLRQYSKFNPSFVRQLVRTMPLSKLSHKEASKYL